LAKLFDGLGISRIIGFRPEIVTYFDRATRFSWVGAARGQIPEFASRRALARNRR